MQTRGRLNAPHHTKNVVRSSMDPLEHLSKMRSEEAYYQHSIHNHPLKSNANQVQ